ncbi:uncharacterized protein SAPINGB_P002592 [Magnusiomyces paraingens]|uniref:Uncharacterized protein n=1 Tax=Magnusiomyces paraingens TaxID=2606893 RepID=A0A5E8BEQ4_9ASCO|nr:uncharacterized protein SAPINGB_P002592 [Saprochaete ingens]VVT50083.1 unnamed protein product [Saprochaete ingens]
METEVNFLSEDSLNAEVSPLSACHLFESSSILFKLSPPELPPNKAHPLSIALNLRHLQTVQANKLLIPHVQEHTIACPSCGCIWIPGINVRVRLITHRTNMLRHRLPKGILLKEHQNEDHNEHENNPSVSKRLSKRARKRKLLKMKQKKKALDHKLNTVYGLDAEYVSTRAKELRKNRKILAYGCGQCHIYHILDPEITNQYPTVSVAASVKKKSNNGLQQKYTLKEQGPNNKGNQDLSEQESLSNLSHSSTTTKTDSILASRKDKLPSKSKSKKKSSLQMLIAKQKESKSNQQFSSGLGLLGLMTKK